MRHSPALLALLLGSALPHLALADVVTGIPDSAPAGFEEWTSPIVLPAPNVTGQGNWASSVARARAFVAKLTFAEKINVTTGVDIFGRCLGNTGTIPRLGWNGLCLHDSPLGVRLADFVSAFPAGINAASTWDRDLIEKRAFAMGSEHKGKGVNVVLGPGTNLARVAAGGRNWEAFGADPFLAGVAAAASIDGYQSAGVIATIKHFIANEQEHFRGGSEAGQIQSSNIDDRTLHEVYSWPFAEAVKAGVGAVMCSYNLINQTQACQNSKLINGLLKEELGFQGFIMSDWAAMINGLQPALAGLDMNMPGFVGYGIGDQDQQDPSTATNSWWGTQLSTMVNNGSLSEARVDDMVTRIFASWYQLGQDKNYPPVSFSALTQETYLDGVKVNDHVNVQADHYKLIREIGAASAVLLKNTKNALPLKVKNLKRIGIFGSDAGANPDGPNGCATGQGDHGCSQGTLAQGWGSGTAFFPYLVDPLSAISAHIRSINPTVVVDGITDDFNLNAISAAASLADTCLVFVNADSGEGYITVDGNAGDRNNLTLWHNGENVIQATASNCANTIVVAHVVGPVLVESWIDHPNVTAFINAGIPGQESGNAIVDVLFADGDTPTNPSGRLAYTIAKARQDYSADVVYESQDKAPQVTYKEALEIDYRHFDANNVEPRYEFGFGLSYTTFAYSGLKTSKKGGGYRRDAEHHHTSTTTAHSSSSAPASSSSTSRVPASPGLSSTATSASSSGSASKSTSASAGPTSVSGSASASISASASASASVSASTSASASASSSSSASTTASALPAISSPINPIGGPTELYETVATVSFTIKNTGSLAGHEVPQLYLGFPASTGEPPKVLRGFTRELIGARASKGVSIDLRRKDVSVWDVVSQKWVIPQGKFNVFVGSSSRDIKLTGSLEF